MTDGVPVRRQRVAERAVGHRAHVHVRGTETKDPDGESGRCGSGTVRPGDIARETFLLPGPWFVRTVSGSRCNRWVSCTRGHASRRRGTSHAALVHGRKVRMSTAKTSHAPRQRLPAHYVNSTDATRGEPLALRAQKRRDELEMALE